MWSNARIASIYHMENKIHSLGGERGVLLDILSEEPENTYVPESKGMQSEIHNESQSSIPHTQNSYVL